MFVKLIRHTDLDPGFGINHVNMSVIWKRSLRPIITVIDASETKTYGGTLVNIRICLLN